MHTSNRIRRGLVVMLTVVASMLALGAASAAASVHWSDTTHGMKVSGSLTASMNGNNKTCTPSAGQSSFYEEEGKVFHVYSNFVLDLRFTCSTGVLGVLFNVSPLTTTSVAVGEGTSVSQESPWGPYLQGTATGGNEYMVGDWTNGSGGTPSKVTFSSDLLGYVCCEGFTKPIKLTGSLNVTTSTGGLLTLLP